MQRVNAKFHWIRLVGKDFSGNHGYPRAFLYFPLHQSDEKYWATTEDMPYLQGRVYFLLNQLK